MTHPICDPSCRFYRVGYTETHPTPAVFSPACEHPTRPAGGLDVTKGTMRADCPLVPLRIHGETVRMIVIDDVMPDVPTSHSGPFTAEVAKGPLLDYLRERPMRFAAPEPETLSINRSKEAPPNPALDHAPDLTLAEFMRRR